ncbi:hypothetical protein THRCLA_04239 [Thraustotheca clavata]|uniref:C3H1-type domain-containing protein n=1 Tax=Thraustotheca clavata TaxID=74557 RepID=A0A1V9ZZK4_9STRA|nr:hypothetical protein THRCLA_04239 [Thraustotheca clavata]
MTTITNGNQLHEVVDGKERVLSIAVKGQLVRKRTVSKNLIFGDIALTDGELIQMMVHSGEASWTKERVIQLNWDIHLGDIVLVQGEIRREETNSNRLLLVASACTVQESWEKTHPQQRFEHNALESVVKEKKDAPPVALATKQTYENMIQLDGKNACKYHFSNTTCQRGDACHFYHGKSEDYAQLRQEWLEKRTIQKRAIAMVDGDPNDPHSKALKSQRAALFVEWLVDIFGVQLLSRGTGVLDVAGGKGDISFELQCKRNIPSTLIDPRVVKQRKTHIKVMREQLCNKWLHIQAELNDELVNMHKDHFENCSAIVGMHPDEATEVIVNTSLSLNKPFAVVPCCVMSRLFPDRVCNNEKIASYNDFVAYLKSKDPRIQSTFLPFEGKNQVVFLLT